MTAQPPFPRVPPMRGWRARLAAFHLAVMEDGVDHPAILARVHQESGWSHRYAFMVLMSAGIAILGLLLGSPAVIIGAMLVSPLMGPIIGLGFALATLDWPQARGSLVALAGGALLAVAFSALIVLASPLQDITGEILARTRPNLFDLLVAVFSALAGSYATIRGRGETIVGVAIATALMPPLAVVGFGFATWNMPVFVGSLGLFATNFIAIALSATLVARFYGFAAHLSPHQSRRQAWALALVFTALSIPLALSLSQIAWETWATRTARQTIAAEFGPAARIGALEPEFHGTPRFRATVFTERFRGQAEADLAERLTASLGRPILVELSQIVVNQDSARADVERARAAADREAGLRLQQADLAARLALLTGVGNDAVTVDPVTRRAIVRLSSATPLATAFALENQLAADQPQWSVELVPALQPLPPVRFAEGSSGPDSDVADQLRLHLWAIERWGLAGVSVAGGRASGEPARLAVERAESVGRLLDACAVGWVEAAPLAVDPAREREEGRAAVRRVILTVPDRPVDRPLAGADDADALPCPRAVRRTETPAAPTARDARGRTAMG